MYDYVVDQEGRVITEQQAVTEEDSDSLQCFAVVDKVPSDSGKEQGA
jgi:hypothetical protein